MTRKFKKSKRPKADAHQIVTDAVIAFLEEHENGTSKDSKWTKPWEALMADGNYCPATGKAYAGVVNSFSLNALSYSHGFKSDAWGTYKQWKSLGTDDKPVNVKQGAKAAYIFVPMIYTRKDSSGQPVTDSNGDEVKGRSFKQVAVFNADQVNGFVEVVPELPVSKIVDDAEVDRFVARTSAAISFGGNRAYYSLAGDHIRLPLKEAFKAVDNSTATEAFYGTELHELIHWTGHEARCKRDLTNGFGSNDYAFEELIAEMGAAMLCNQFGISDAPRDDHAKYIKSWLRGLKGDKTAVFKAASAASKAIKHLETYQ